MEFCYFVLFDNQVGFCFSFFLSGWSQIKEKGGPVVTQVSLQSCRNKNGERIHMPFKPSYPMFPSAMAVRKEDKEEFPIHGLSLCTPGIKNQWRNQLLLVRDQVRQELFRLPL